MPQIERETPVTVYRAPDHYANQAIITRCPNGDLLCIFNEERGMQHADNGYTTLVRSTDGGRSWDPASRVVVLPATELVGNWDPAITPLRDGRLMVNLCLTAFFQRGIAWAGPQYDASEYLAFKGWTGTAVLTSSDNGWTWSEPVPVNIKPMKHGGTRVGVLELPDGGLLLPLYGKITDSGISPLGETTRAFAVRSDDGGRNWEYCATLAYDPGHIISFSEPALLRLASGRLIGVLRAHVRPGQRPDNMYLVTSDDDGFSWSAPRRLALWGYPAHLLTLQDGRVLMTFGYRRHEFGVKGCVSEDGLTWDPANQFTIHAGGQAPPSEPTWWHTGYPCSTQLPDGTLVTVYHYFATEPRPLQFIESVRWRLVDAG